LCAQVAACDARAFTEFERARVLEEQLTESKARNSVLEAEGRANVAEIARQGYKSIINNRPDGEAGPQQPLNAEIEMAAKSLGLNYAYLPVVSGQITLEQAQEMARLLETMPGPVLAFCRSGARSTNLYMLAQQVG
jgi:uncharacterized protein (TIGR01244 family)